jgi:lipoprotein
MKYWIAMFPLLLAACANTVEVKDKDDFKCGEQIVRAEFLDDDSIILQINGVNNVLTKVAAASGKRYENIATQIVFMQQNGDYYLTIKGRNYPVCRKIER